MVNQSTPSDLIVGIDLGTTNSEVAVYLDGRIEVIASSDGETIMPSVVGLTPEGQLLVATPAKNQALVYPERTIASVKRHMGSNDALSLGEKTLRPQEVSAIILRELKQRAEARLNRPVTRAVITVPAFFSDAQRQATRDAGELAGFEVMRILNEPTAASLAYEGGASGAGRLVLVYDLGGGTFDVSIVETCDGVTEVLASHGDTRLGGDDFDRLLLNDVIETMIRDGKPNPRPHRLAMSRLTRAVVAAKHELSSQPYARIREEHLLTHEGVPVHLDLEVSRVRYEELIRPLVDKTFFSISQALRDAGKKPADLDAVLLVGGMTRTPLVEQRLADELGKMPRRDVHPDLAVAIGAGVQAARLCGHDDGRVLVDITPYSFGPEAAEVGPFGIPVPDVFVPMISKGTPLPVKETEEFRTLVDAQCAWEVKVFQGENPIASQNVLIGRFIADGFSNVPAGNAILCTLELNLDGILHVTVVEKHTGLSKRVRIENAMGRMAHEELARARRNLDEFFSAPQYADQEQESETDDSDDDEVIDVEIVPGRVDGVDHRAAASPEVSGQVSGPASSLHAEAWKLVARARERLKTSPEGDRPELEGLIERLEQTMATGTEADQRQVLSELDDLLYYLDDR